MGHLSTASGEARCLALPRFYTTSTVRVLPLYGLAQGDIVHEVEGKISVEPLRIGSSTERESENIVAYQAISEQEDAKAADLAATSLVYFVCTTIHTISLAETVYEELILTN